MLMFDATKFALSKNNQAIIKLISRIKGFSPYLDMLTYCNNYIATLSEIAPSLAPTNLRGFAIDHSRISLEWDAPPTISFNGILSAYVVNVTERETGFTFELNTTNTSITLTALHPDYVYECRVAAYTIAAGPFSVIFAVQVRMAGTVMCHEI